MGTAFPKAYMYSWNDEFIAMNGFSEVIKNSVSAIAHQMNTQAQGRAVVVYNPVAMEREDVVNIELTYAKLPQNVKVVDKNGNTIPSQIVTSKGNKLTVIFLAKFPSAALAVYDIIETKEKAASSTLMVADQTLENNFFKIKIDANGDIASIYDKTALREVLSKPATLQFLNENPSEWPAWNMDWKDRKNPPIDSLNKEVTIKVIENGPVRIALEVTKKGLNSEITQIISLAAGEAGKRIEVKNKLDWQSKEVSLKAAFPTTVSNEFATYGMSAAAIQRTTNNEVKYEVPGRQWFDITDRSSSYGVSIFEDCKYGSDKPDNNTVRLTLMYMPKANSYVYQGTQDWGIHDIKYAIYPHAGDWPTYYATGISSDGKAHQNTKTDLASIINSGVNNTSDSIWFNNGEGRYVIDLQKLVSIDKINFYLDQFRERGNQIFSMWGSENSSNISGDPKEKGFQYIGIFNGGRRGLGIGGTSIQFENAPAFRYIMFISDGSWHGKDFLKQVDVFTK